MWRWSSGPVAITTGTGKTMSAVGRTNRARQRHAMSTIPDTRSAIRRRAIAVPILIFALIWSLTGTSTSTEPRGGQARPLSSNVETPPRITIELDVFSGRPNPTWNLTPGQAQELLRVLDVIRRDGRTRPPCQVPGLGYRGFHVRTASDAQSATWQVFDGCVEYDGQFFDDSGRVAENYLLEAMPAQLKRDLTAVLPHILR